MNGLTSFEAKDYETKKKLYRFNLDDVDYTLESLFSTIFNDFIERFNFTTFYDTLNSCMDFIKDKNNGIDPADLFEYTTFKNDFLVGKDMIYTRKYVQVKGSDVEKTTFYDVYVGINNYASLSLNKIAKHLFLTAYPSIMEFDPLVSERRKYPECIHNLTELTRVKDIDRLLDCQFDFQKPLLINDLIKVMIDPDEADRMVVDTTIKIYGDGNIFVPLAMPDEAISMKASDFKFKDWNAVLTRTVWHVTGSIMQKDTPCFKNDNIIVPFIEKLVKG